MIPVDLHCHSTVSDGLLPPREVVRLAHSRGCKLFALTDHDDLRGLPDAADEAQKLGMPFVNGVEISVSWGKHNLHIVGLGFDRENPALCAGLEQVRSGRWERAERMAASLLAKAGIADALAGARKYAENPEMISRAHFARYIVEIGKAKDVRSVFYKFLKPGMPGYVEHEWARLHEAVQWITGAGGVAVLAHPGRYRLTRTEMRAFLGEFKDGGGTGIEVITSSHSTEQYLEYAVLAKEFGLLASRGSDFHGPGESRIDLGRLPNLAPGLKPVWHDW